MAQEKKGEVRVYDIKDNRKEIKGEIRDERCFPSSMRIKSSQGRGHEIAILGLDQQQQCFTQFFNRKAYENLLLMDFN